MGTFFQDLKHSVRMFGERKAFTVTTVAALALGIAATTAIFSVVNAVLLKPVPFPEPDQLVMFMNTSPGAPGPFSAASPANFHHWRSQSTIQNAAAFRTGIVNYTSGGVAEPLRSAQESADYFK